VDRLSSSCSHDRVPTQSSFEFSKSQLYFKQPFSKFLVGNASIGAISHKGRHQRTDVVVLFQPRSVSLPIRWKLVAVTGYRLSEAAVSGLQRLPSGAKLLASRWPWYYWNTISKDCTKTGTVGFSKLW